MILLHGVGLSSQNNSPTDARGHTHGGQMQFFGWRPTSIRQAEDHGLYEQNGRYLYVTAGLGGLVPLPSQYAK